MRHRGTEAQRRETPEMMVEFVCHGCGDKWRQRVAHYDVVRCGCGKLSWALEPRRDGPLVCFAHPDPLPGERWMTR